MLFSHSLIIWVILSFRIVKTLCITNRKSWGAEILGKCLPTTMCHKSCASCHWSRVMCHILSFLIWIWIYKLVKLVGGGSVINGSTPSSFSWLILWKNKHDIEKKTHLWKKHFWCSLGASSRLELKREIQNKLYCYTGPLSNIPIESTNFECA